MGYRIRELREAMKMTQEELADKSGVSRGTISALENGSMRNTTSKTLLKLAQALNTSVDRIFFTETVYPTTHTRKGDDCMNLGRRLKKLRGGRSGDEVASELGISASSLRMYETNQRTPRDSVKMKMANYFGLTVQDLFYEEQEVSGMGALLTRKEAAARLGITVMTLDAERNSGHLAYIQRKPGGKVWITEEALAEYLARATHPARPDVKAARALRQVRRA